MRREENHKHEAAVFFDRFVETGDETKIVEYLVSNSNLPGPRANTESGEAFAQLVEEYVSKDASRVFPRRRPRYGVS